MKKKTQNKCFKDLKYKHIANPKSLWGSSDGWLSQQRYFPIESWQNISQHVYFYDFTLPSEALTL